MTAEAKLGTGSGWYWLSSADERETGKLEEALIKVAWTPLTLSQRSQSSFPGQQSVPSHELHCWQHSTFVPALWPCHRPFVACAAHVLELVPYNSKAGTRLALWGSPAKAARGKSSQLTVMHAQKRHEL